MSAGGCARKSANKSREKCRALPAKSDPGSKATPAPAGKADVKGKPAAKVKVEASKIGKKVPGGLEE